MAIMAVIAATVGMFLWGRFRHDIVALAALLACVATGLIPSGSAFSGFGHPAVITVACVLVLSNALQSTGVVDGLTRLIIPKTTGPTVTIAAITGLAAILSGFMNNVGALALLMPIALQVADRLQFPPGRILMPLAFGSILGGMTTLIGTPPNLIVSGFRVQASGTSFSMFDFTPVGMPVAIAGLLFLVLIGWRLVPDRQRKGTDGFETGAYLTEARIPEESKAAGMTLREIEAALNEADAQVVGLIRDELPIAAPSPYREVRVGDILIIEAEPEALAEALSSLQLKLEEDVRSKDENDDVKESSAEQPARSGTDTDPLAALQSEDVVLMELAVRPMAELVGRSATDINLRKLYGINLLAIAREGHHSAARLRSVPIMEGDVLLMQGTPDAISDFANRFGCMPLAQRPLRIPDRRKALLASIIMLTAVGGAALGLVPAAISFAAGMVAIVVARVLPARRLYEAIDWSVITLLAALIPIAGAMASTGAADLIAKSLLSGAGSAVVALVLILVVTMILSDFMNNAATAAVMCPIALGAATQLGVNADPFLMAVAVGASCAFLTPIGHQNNTLILGPGGFRFGDYWPLGVPLEIVVLLVSVPMILLVWPL
jgi:di/tricarboxylate transporter